MATDKENEFDVGGKIAIVTGAGSGINFSFASLLLSRNCSVLLADLSLRPEAQELLSQYPATGNTSPRALFCKTDVTAWPDLERMFRVAEQKLGEVDIVCPGAGIYDPAWSNFWHPPGTDKSKDAVEGGRYKTLDVNLTHPIRVTQMAVSAFLRAGEKEGQRARKQKRVLLVSSIAGQTTNLHTPIYVAAKHAVNGFIRSLAPLDARYNIRVCGVAPGVVKTPLWTEHPEKLQFIAAGQDEWATPEEVAEAMVRCLEEEELGGGSILEVGKGQTRLVGQFMDPGPSGRGHTVGNLVEKYGEVYALLDGGGWGKAKL